MENVLFSSMNEIYEIGVVYILNKDVPTFIISIVIPTCNTLSYLDFLIVIVRTVNYANSFV